MKNFSIKITTSKDKSYYCCSCNLSKTQPFYNDPHRDDKKGRKSVHYISLQNTFINFCVCKKTNHSQFCDAGHNKK